MILDVTDKVNMVRYINFVGNYQTKDETMRRILFLQESRPLTAELLQLSEIQLRNLPFLKNVTIEPVLVGENQYDLKVTIVEADTFTMQGSGNYDDSGISFVAEAQEKNLFGKGQSLGTSLSISAKKQHASLTFAQPFFTAGGVTQKISVDASRVSKDSDHTLTYRTDGISLGLGYTIPVSRKLSMSTDFGMLYSKYYDVEKASLLVREFFDLHPEAQKQYRVDAGLFYSDLDSRYMPTNGLLFQAIARTTLPIPDAVTFYQLEAQAEFYRKLTSYNDQPVVLRARVTGKYGHGYGDYSEGVPFYARYYAGGIPTVRGYDNQSLGPQYTDGLIQKSKGGNKLLVGNLELQLPSYKPDLAIPYLFVDYGNVFDENQSIEWSDMRGSAGMSLVLTLPMGTLSMTVATPINDQEGDKFTTFSFGMGKMF